MFVKLIVLESLGLSVTRPALSALLNGRASLSSEMAIRLEKAFAVDMESLMNMQTAYNIAEARKRSGRINVKRYKPKGLRGEKPTDRI